MNKRRLRVLRNFLANKKFTGHFDMTRWAGQIRNKQPTCGTAACAAGWATTIPSFRKAGLYLTVWGPAYQDLNTRSSDGSTNGYNALARFFGISYDDASELFDPSKYHDNHVEPEDVVERLDTLLAGGVLSEE